MVTIAKDIVTCINPILSFLIIVAAVMRRDDAGRFVVLSAVGIAIAVWLAEIGKEKVILPGQPWFPSGHMAFAVAAATCLAVRNIRWLWLGAPVCCIMGGGLVAAHFHHPIDILGALALGPIPPLITFSISRLAENRGVRILEDE